MSVRRAQREIDSAEFAEWIEYFNLDPFGNERDDLRFAMLTANLVNAMPLRGRNARLWKPKDFMPAFGPKKRQTPAEMFAITKVWAATHNAMLAAKRKRGSRK